MSVLTSLARFVHSARFEDLSAAARTDLEIHLLDALACAFGALGAPLVRSLRATTRELGREGSATLVGGGHASPDHAAFYNAALVRYLDFNDSYLAPGETCHPSDNLGAVLAAAEHTNASGRDLLLALAAAYQVQLRLSDEAPVRERGFDHVTHLGYSAAAGAAKALGLAPDAIAAAIAMSGVAQNPLRVTRTGALSPWKGLAAANAGLVATHAACRA
jgi:2-methylcitrate dehydratase